MAVTNLVLPHGWGYAPAGRRIPDSGTTMETPELARLVAAGLLRAAQPIDSDVADTIVEVVTATPIVASRTPAAIVRPNNAPMVGVPRDVGPTMRTVQTADIGPAPVFMPSADVPVVPVIVDVPVAPVVTPVASIEPELAVPVPVDPEPTVSPLTSDEPEPEPMPEDPVVEPVTPDKPTRRKAGS